ncbi:MAG: hypothetical protein A2Y55_03175 [Actinobacteria bacterium RBG_16_68_12]|nr:MAG: hypothetical protein A2Y55_03175 [Actinobacteria bacterium RBG_16_68_12]
MPVLVSALLALVLRRARPLGLALMVYETWRRLPPEHRQRLLLAARRHGPRAASRLVRRGRPRA